MNNERAFILACEAYYRGQKFVGTISCRDDFLAMMEALLGGKYRYAVEVDYRITRTIMVYGGKLKTPYTIGFTGHWSATGIRMFKEDVTMMLYRYYGGDDLNTYELIELVREYIVDNAEDFEG